MPELNMKEIKKIMPHVIMVGLFAIISLAYFSPLLSGKKLYQSDIANYKGMSKEIQDHREQYGEEPYWTNSMFGGMPAYQISVLYNYDWVKSLDRVIRSLPHPASMLFLYFISFYLMMVLLGYNWRIASIGALAFGLSTYLLVIIEAGHNAKAHAIAYFPLITAGILLAFRGKYLKGTVITALFMALEISANHFQMTYYLGLLILVFGIIQLVKAIKEKELLKFGKAFSVLTISVIIAFGANATKLMSTYEYTKYSTRGKSELSIDKDKSEKTNGLDRAYITQWSYGKLETFNLMIPGFMGGASAEPLGEDSNLAVSLKGRVPAGQLKQILRNVPTYWGDQPGTSGPAYIGAIVFFLFVLGLFIVKGPLKWWLLSGSILSILLSWGHNFNWLTNLMLDFFPFYDKFRAVSSIQVIVEFAAPFLAVLALHEWFYGKTSELKKVEYLRNSLIATAGIALLFLIFGPGMLDFTGMADEQYRQMGFPMDAIVDDRIEMFRSDSVRTIILIVLAAAVMFFSVKGKVKQAYTFIVLALLIVIDLGGVDKRYLNDENFVAKRQVDNPFPLTDADMLILQDTSVYRVLDMQSPMQNAATSYHHHSVGGYHGAKLKRYQELWDLQVSQNNQEVLNMLNTKYFIFNNQGERQVSLNDEANGNAWFVDKVNLVDTPDDEIKALSTLNTLKEAVVNKKFADNFPSLEFVRDSLASIELISYKANELVYKTISNNDGVAVFSEIYYPKGWKATIDGVEAEISQANYVLRSLWIPKGNHEIVFKFEPDVIKKGDTITLISNIILFSVLLISIALWAKSYFLNRD